MRTLSPIQKAIQDDKSQTLCYKVLRKDSEDALDIEYEDITSIVTNISLSLNGEGEPNSAVFEVPSTKGIYDFLNVKSSYRHYFQKGTKFQIYLGFSIADTLIFTGYAQEFYDHDYTKGSAEKVAIKLYDRGKGTGKIDYQAKINTREYRLKDLSGDPNPGYYWTAKEIIEDVLQREGKMDISEIHVHAELDEIDVHSVQFVDETIWNIIQLCCETRQHVGYFDERGHFQTMPLQFTTTTYSEGTDESGTFTKTINHFVDDSDLLSKMTAIGGIKIQEDNATELTVIDVDPTKGLWGRKATFEAQTNGTGNAGQLDSLYGMWDPPGGGLPVDDSLKCYGVGFQGTCIPMDSNGIVNDIDPDHNDPHPANPEDPANWLLAVAGPFKFTINGIPCEPVQDPKMGIGDGTDMGPTGFFTKYNQDGGTVTSIDPDSLSEKAKSDYGRYWPTLPIGLLVTPYSIPSGDESNPSYYRAVMSVIGEILPTEEEWYAADWNQGMGDNKNGVPRPLQFPYPFPGVDKGPTATDYYIFMLTFTDYFFYWLLLFDPPQPDFETLVSPWFHRVFHWGKTWTATLNIPEQHYVGTAIDSEIAQYYPGTNRYDSMENPLLFNDGSCQYLGELVLDRLRKFHVQARFTRPLHLELQFGDVIEVYNSQTECTEKVCLTRLDYKITKNSTATIEMRGGVINVEGTEIKAWR